MKKLILLWLTILTLNASAISIQYPLGTGGTGSGDVVGPASSTLGNIPLFADTTGKKLNNGLTSTAFGQNWINYHTAAQARTALGVSRQFSFGIDGGTSVPATGNLNAVYVSPITCTVATWYIGSDVTGNAVLDIKRNGASIIGAGNKPTLSSASKATANASSWTSTAITAGDRLTFVLDSIATAKAVTVVIKVTE